MEPSWQESSALGWKPETPSTCFFLLEANKFYAVGNIGSRSVLRMKVRNQNPIGPSLFNELARQKKLRRGWGLDYIAICSSPSCTSLRRCFICRHNFAKKAGRARRIPYCVLFDNTICLFLKCWFYGEVSLFWNSYVLGARCGSVVCENYTEVNHSLMLL